MSVCSHQVLGGPITASPRLRGFIDGMRHWMHGYQDWYDRDTRRYSDEFIGQDADDTAVLPDA